MWSIWTRSSWKARRTMIAVPSSNGRPTTAARSTATTTCQATGCKVFNCVDYVAAAARMPHQAAGQDDAVVPELQQTPLADALRITGKAAVLFQFDRKPPDENASRRKLGSRAMPW